MKREQRRNPVRGRHGRRGRHGGHGSRWRTAAALIGLALLVAAGAAAAQVYKWKDAQGVTHYGDTAPPQGAQVLKAASGSAPDAASDAAANLPYELARAVRQYPVTLYTTARCNACERGRTLLRERGVPFTEKTVATQEDQQQLRRLSGNDRLPLLVVGNRRETGFKASSWQEMLDSAAYPRQNLLPSGYRAAAPESAAPAPASSAGAPGGPVRAQIKVPPDEAAAQAQAAQARTPAREKLPPAGNAPPNFQF